VVERRVFRVVSRSFLGIIVVTAVKPRELPFGVQATSASNAAARLAKARAQPRLHAWLAGSRSERGNPCIRTLLCSRGDICSYAVAQLEQQGGDETLGGAKSGPDGLELND
jgi:hypothetical protein